MNDIDDIIMGGMVFKAGGGPKKEDDGKVKTKAKKKKYITGAHGSGSAGCPVTDILQSLSRQESSTCRFDVRDCRELWRLRRRTTGERQK